MMTKADLDAFVSIAVDWTLSGALATTPDQVREVLTVTPEQASTVGAQLWLANCETALCAESGGIDFDRVQAMGYDPANFPPPYRFERFPGRASPNLAVHRAGYYKYQTGHDDWDPWSDDAPLPFEAIFTYAMQWLGLHQLGLIGDFPDATDLMAMDEIDYPEDPSTSCTDRARWSRSCDDTI